MIAKVTGIDPQAAIVIDDKKKNLDLASEIGYNTIHSGMEGEKEGNHPYFTTSDQLHEILFSDFL